MTRISRVPDEALPVQKAAAEEPAQYAGKITGKTLAVMPWSKHAAEKAKGLVFFVGEGVAEKAMGHGKPRARRELGEDDAQRGYHEHPLREH